MTGLYEILTEKKWMVSPDFVHGIRKALEQNLNTHAAFTRPEKTCGFVTAVDAMGNVYYPEEYQISEDGTKVRGQWALSGTDNQGNSEQDFPFVSVLTVDGPVTRNGGGCSYGSIDHRDMMMKAANHPLCCGHVFILNTPGGSAWAKNDYQQAIEYAHSLGQPVIAFIDGMCASAGMYLASLCDERYYMHPRNEVGCIGVMAAFYTEADGSKNQFTNETYHELYDPESFDKNKSFRDIANDDDSKLLVKELADLGVEFRADVKKACPSATDEHLHGKVFDARDVEGILVDGQATFFDCITRAFSLFRNEAEPIKRESAPEPTPEPEPEPAPMPEPKKPEANAQAQTSNNNINMSNYPLTMSALGVEELQVSEEGTFMNAALLDTLESHLATQQQAVADAQAEAKEMADQLLNCQASLKETEEQLATAQSDKEIAEKALAEADEAHKNALAEANEAHEALVSGMKEGHEAVLAEKAEQIEGLNAHVASLEEELKGAKDALATAEQSLADKDAQIAALTAAPAAEPQAGEAPANNGTQAEAPKMVCGAPQYNPNLSPAENARLLNEYRRSHIG